MQPPYQTKLCSHIRQVNTLEEVVRLARHMDIPVVKWKAFCLSHAEEMNEQGSVKALFNTQSLTSIMPSDVTTEIERFVHCRTNPLINSEFHNSFMRNEIILQKQRQETVERLQHQFDPNIPVDGHCWMVFHKRDNAVELSSEELDVRHMIRSTDSLTECIRNAQSGDTIWIEPGIYSIDSTETELCIIDKQIRLIGRGDSVIIDSGQQNWSLQQKARMLLDNVEIRFDQSRWNHTAGITIEGESHLWMRNCIISGIPRRGTLIMLQCDGCNTLEMLSSKMSGENAIHAVGSAQTVKAIGCTFDMERSIICSNGALNLFGCVLTSGGLGGTLQQQWKLSCNVVGRNNWCPMIQKHNLYHN